MGRFVLLALLVALAACEKEAVPRLFTEQEIAALEARIPAAEACQRPELARFIEQATQCEKPSRGPCVEAAPLDIGAFGPAAATWPGCSPLGPLIDDPGDLAIFGLMHAGDTLEIHARGLEDHAAALDELVDGMRVFQDLGRGRRTVIATATMSVPMNKLVAAGMDIVEAHDLPPARLDALASKLDGLIAHAPGFGETWLGELTAMADWLRHAPRSSDPSNHRDTYAVSIASFVRIMELLPTLCPREASLAACHERLPPADDKRSADPLADREAEIRSADAPGRERLKQEIVERAAQKYMSMMRGYLATSAVSLTRLIALRIAVEVKRTGRCAAPAELLASSVLGDSVRVSAHEHSLTLGAPPWAYESPYSKKQTFVVKCP